MPSSVVKQRAAFVGWGVALWLALAGQVAVVTGAPFEAALPRFLGAMLVAFVSSLGWPALPACKVPLASPMRVSLARLVALLAGGLLVLFAVPLTAAQVYAAAAITWVVGIVVIVVTCVVRHRPTLRRPSTTTLVLIGITLGAFVLRVVNLTSLPPEVHGDEAAIGNEARRILGGEAPDLFGLGWYQIDEVAFAISAAVMRVFGDNLFGLRLTSAIEGTLSVTFTFLLARRLFSTRVAVMAACFLAVAEMHLHYSRTGFIYIQACLVTVMLLYLAQRALDHRGVLDYVLLGLAGGVSLLVYAAVRLAPVLLVLYLAHHLVRERLGFVRAHTLGLGIAAVTALILFSPMSVVYSRDPSLFNVRTGDISVLSGPGYEHELSAYHVDTLADILRIQTQKTLEAFVYSGETSQQYGHVAPLLDPWTGALFIAGVGAFAWRLRHPAYFLLTTWLWLSLLLGAVLTVDAPFSPHLVGMLPLIGLYPALFLEAGWRAAERLKPAAAWPAFGVGAAALALLALVANVRDYTQIHAVVLQPASFATTLAHYITQVNDRYRVYLISRPDTSINYETTRFLAPNPDAVDLHEAPLTDVRPPSNGKGLAFVIEASLPTAGQHLEEVRQRYPGGREETVRNTRGAPLFVTYLVPQPEPNAGARG